MAADKDGDKPIQREIATWMRNFREEWFAKLEPEQDPLGARARFVFALSGSLTWSYGTFFLALENPDLTEILNVLAAAGIPSLLVIFAFGIPYSCLLAFLVAYRHRKSAPIRFFLDGILLPTAVAAILQLTWSPSTPTMNTPETAAALQESLQ